MKEKLLDIRNLAILILGAALIISFFFGQKDKTDYHKDEINELKTQNKLLFSANDSIMALNRKIDGEISAINLNIQISQGLIQHTQLQIDKLKKQRDEIPSRVNSLSNDSVAIAFSNYLNSKSASKKGY